MLGTGCLEQQGNMSQPSISFTGRDWDTNLARLVEVIRAQVPDQWNSLYDGDLGRVLLELIAYDQTLLSYLVDAQAQESFIDTLVQRESLTHFARLTGYNIRRATASTLSAYCRTTVAPATSDIAFIIPKLAQIRSKDGQVWEVAADAKILPGFYTPRTVLLQYQQVQGRVYHSDGTSETQDAMVRIDPGSSHAILVGTGDPATIGMNRFPSTVNFGTIDQGSILVLAETCGFGTGFSAPPPVSLAEYAVISSGSLTGDTDQGSVLFLDRPWAGQTPFVGKWSIENRNISLINGQTKTETITVPSLPFDTAGFSLTSAFYPVLGGTTVSTLPAGYFASAARADIGVQVRVDGVLWQPTSALSFEAPDAQVYEYDFDSLDRFTIMFGDGQFGARIPNGASIGLTYRIGGGNSGNLPQNFVDTTVTIQNYGQPATPVTAYISNPYTIGKGGSDRETIADAKRNIPIHVRTNDRGVTTEDYGYLASHFSDPKYGSIALAVGVLHKNQVPKEQNLIWVYAWVKGGGGVLVPPSYELKSALYAYLSARKMITDEVVVVDGISTHVPMHVRYKFAPSADPVAVQEKVQAALNGVMSAQTPGTPLRVSSLYSAIRSIPDIDFVGIYGPLFDMQPNNGFEVFINTLQIPQRTTLAAPLSKGDVVVSVADPTIFVTGGTVGFFETGSHPFVGIIESVDYGASSNQIVLRSGVPGSYTGASVINSDFLVDGWQFERPVAIYVKFIADDPSGQIATAVFRAINQYFRITLRPQEVLYRSVLADAISKVQDIFDVKISIGTPDSDTEQVAAGPFELLVPSVISINGAVLASTPEIL